MLKKKFNDKNAFFGMRKIMILAGLLIVLSIFSVGLSSATNDNVNYVKTTLLNQDPDPAQPGQYVELRFKVEKQGADTLKNVSFTLDAPYPFSFDPSDKPTKVFGDMKGYTVDDGYYILYYKLRVDSDALEDTYTVKLRESDNNGKMLITKEFDIRVNNDKPEFVLGTLVTSPKKLTGYTTDGELDVELENIGEMDAQNVIMTVNLPKGFKETYGYSNRANLGTITAGASKTAKFFIDLDEGMKGGVYETNVTIQYKEANSNYNKYKITRLQLGIPIKSSPIFEIEKVETNPQTIRPGDTVELKVFIKNVGGADADSTSMRVFKESSQPFSFNDKTDYIGKLISGETGEALLKFTVDKDATSKEYLLDVELRAIDDDVITQDKIINVQVGNASSGSSGKVIGLIVLAIVIIASAYIFFKKRNSANKKKGN